MICDSLPRPSSRRRNVQRTERKLFGKGLRVAVIECRHEIVGIVTEVGAKAAEHFKVGDRAGVGCFVRACRVSAPLLTFLT